MELKMNEQYLENTLTSKLNCLAPQQRKFLRSFSTMPGVIDHKFHTHLRFLVIQFDSDNFNLNVKIKIFNKYFKMDPEESVPKECYFCTIFWVKIRGNCSRFDRTLWYINKTVLNVLSYIYQYLKLKNLDNKVLMSIYKFGNYTEIILSMSINLGVKQPAC